jgi:hypothetical protein
MTFKPEAQSGIALGWFDWGPRIEVVLIQHAGCGASVAPQSHFSVLPCKKFR